MSDKLNKLSELLKEQFVPFENYESYESSDLFSTNYVVFKENYRGVLELNEALYVHEISERFDKDLNFSTSIYRNILIQNEGSEYFLDLDFNKTEYFLIDIIKSIAKVTPEYTIILNWKGSVERLTPKLIEKIK